jgi:hypothetical protein
MGHHRYVIPDLSVKSRLFNGRLPIILLEWQMDYSTIYGETDCRLQKADCIEHKIEEIVYQHHEFHFSEF